MIELFVLVVLVGAVLLFLVWRPAPIPPHVIDRVGRYHLTIGAELAERQTLLVEWAEVLGSGDDVPPAYLEARHAAGYFLLAVQCRSGVVFMQAIGVAPAWLAERSQLKHLQDYSAGVMAAHPVQGTASPSAPAAMMQRLMTVAAHQGWQIRSLQPEEMERMEEHA